MPPRIWELISHEDPATTQLAGVVPRLAALARRDSDLQQVFLCTEQAVQVTKLPQEGAHFCGYRNIQMLLLALMRERPELRANLPEDPTIPKLQRLIEDAWDAGINAHARAATGGIVQTRKHIGPSEAEALLLHFNIACTGHAFHQSSAWNKLLDTVEAYFRSAPTSIDAVVVQTHRPPLFLQRPAHSITIVGLEVLRSGKRRLLTFDPQWRPPALMRRPIEEVRACAGWTAQLALWRYRKSLRYLKRYADFELLTID